MPGLITLGFSIPWFLSIFPDHGIIPTWLIVPFLYINMLLLSDSAFRTLLAHQGSFQPNRMAEYN